MDIGNNVQLFPKKFQEPTKIISVLTECDILVCGGGPAGMCAAVSAKRCDPKLDVLLIEQDEFLGGTITRTGLFTLDASTYIVLDADGGEVFLRDGTAGNYGSLLRNGANDLTIASGSTQALIFSGANAAFQGNLSASGAQVSFANLPTSDPGVAGRLWRDGTTVKISV